MSHNEARADGIRTLLSEASDLEVFSPVVASLRELSAEDPEAAGALVERAREVFDRLKAAQPLRVEQKSHWTFSNHTALIDPCSVTFLDERKFEPSSYTRPAFGLARTLRLGNAGRWDKKLTAKYGALLAALEAFASFEGLEILEQKLGPKGVSAFAASPHLKNLKALSISGSKSGAEGAGAIASNPALSGLEILVLSQGRLGDAGVKALARSPHLGSLRVLVLEENQLGEAALAAIATSPTFDRLEHLVLHSNKKIGDAGIEHLAHASHLSALVTLDMNNVGMRAAGARALAASPLIGRLQALDARDSSMTSKVEDLIKNSPNLDPDCALRI